MQEDKNNNKKQRSLNKGWTLVINVYTYVYVYIYTYTYKICLQNAGDPGSIPASGRSPGKGIPTPVFLPGEFHGQSRLEGCSPWGHKESDINWECICFHTCI